MLWTDVLGQSPERTVLMVLSDSTTVCAYIRKQGGTKSCTLCHLALDLLTFCDVHGFSLHIPGRVCLSGRSQSSDTFSDGVVSSPGRIAEDSTPLSRHGGGLVGNPLQCSAASVGSPFPDNTAVAVDGLAAIGQDETSLQQSSFLSFYKGWRRSSAA